jgi:alpha-tubulin suppressor-like RCC1 family protein
MILTISSLLIQSRGKTFWEACKNVWYQKKRTDNRQIKTKNDNKKSEEQGNHPVSFLAIISFVKDIPRIILLNKKRTLGYVSGVFVFIAILISMSLTPSSLVMGYEEIYRDESTVIKITRAKDVFVISDSQIDEFSNSNILFSISEQINSRIPKALEFHSSNIPSITKSVSNDVNTNYVYTDSDWQFWEEKGNYGSAFLLYIKSPERKENDTKETELNSKWMNQLATQLSTPLAFLEEIVPESGPEPNLNLSISTGSFSIISITQSGVVQFIGDAFANVMGSGSSYEWNHVVSVAAGHKRSIGLFEDGRIITTYRYLSEENKRKAKWKPFTYLNRDDVIQVVAGYDHVAVLRADGTVDAEGANVNGQCDVSEWQDIITISAGDTFTVGLTMHGEIVTTNSSFNELIRNERENNSEKWQNIKAISAGGGTPDTITLPSGERRVIRTGHILILKEDGSVLAIGENSLGQCNVDDWSNIKIISAGLWHSVAMTHDDTFVYAGGKCDFFEQTHNEHSWNGMDIVMLSAAWGYTVAVDSEGNGHAIGYQKNGIIDKINNWHNIRTNQMK